MPTTSEFAALETVLLERGRLVEEALQRLVPKGESPSVVAAVNHSLFAPAKRMRPILALLVTELLRGEPRKVLPAACAVEMVHTASLILDDLPCMDDAVLRRGRPACHVEHGEATAILAAFALLNRAYEVLAEDAPAAEAMPGAALARDLAGAVGLAGMIAGQAADLATTNENLDFSRLEFIHSRKSGALFIAAAALGAAAAGANASERAAVTAYAKNLGLAFQIVDDLIDATSEPGEAGKDTGKDRKKTTFVAFAGVKGARELAQDLATASQEALLPFGPRAEPLRELARYVVARRR